MALGKRREKQAELFVPTSSLQSGPGHVFYSKLNTVLAEAGFDAFVEGLCAPYYRNGGRPGIPPGIYFRMVFVGYFEGLDSQRGIAWRCADSLALRNFLGLAPTEPTPVHASMSVIRQRLPGIVFEQVFQFVLGLLDQRQLLRGKTLGIDATTLEANAAMKSIVRKDGGGDWQGYLRTLARAEGIENPTEEDLRRLDRGRSDKKVSNENWESPSDPDARIARMKDGTTHLAYKAEHAVDLETEAIVCRPRGQSQRTGDTGGGAGEPDRLRKWDDRGGGRGGQGIPRQPVAGAVCGVGGADVHPGTEAEEAGVAGQARGDGEGVPREPAKGSGDEGPTSEPAPERAM